MSDTDTLKALLNVLTDEQKAQLLSELARDKPAVEETPEPVETVATVRTTNKPKGRVREDFTVERSPAFQESAKRPVRAGKNTWQDVGDIGEKREKNFDPTVYEKMGKAERRQVAPEKVELTCYKCSRKFEVLAGHAYGEFPRCDRCVAR